MKYITLVIITFNFVACNIKAASQNLAKPMPFFSPYLSKKDSSDIIKFFELHKNSSFKSKSLGSVSNGKLENGKLMPFFGKNYTYFDKDSYLGARAFTNEKVLRIILDSYYKLQLEFPNRHFFLMELSNRNGGGIFPHKTHQNGLSTDFMMPKLKNDTPYYGLDTLGKDHYELTFNDNGEYSEDHSVKIDFNLIARHILLLNQEANKIGYRITKVIIKIEYKDSLFSTEFGKKLLESDIYIVKKLSNLVNNLHDDHYHIDFGKL